MEEHNNSFKKIVSVQTAIPGTNIESFETIPQDAFRKHKQLIKYENILKESDTARKQLVSLTYCITL